MNENINVDEVKKEIARLRKIFKEIPENKKKLVEGLIVQAARLRISLDTLWQDICDNGTTELFSQSEKTEPYERERPVVRIFNTHDKNYQSIIKILTDALPEEAISNAGAELLGFAFSKSKK